MMYLVEFIYYGINLVLSDIYPFMGASSNKNSEGLSSRNHDPDRVLYSI